MVTVGTSTGAQGPVAVNDGSRETVALHEVQQGPIAVKHSSPNAVTVRTDGSWPVAVRDTAPSTVATKDDVGNRVILAGLRGAAGQMGVPGPAGDSVVQRTAGETLSALRAVYELDGVVRYLDYRDAGHVDLLVGVTITSGLAGEPVNVQLVGPLTDTSWQWVPGPVWLGSLGQLTQAPPDDGFDVLIGSAVSATRIQLNLQRPIELE